MKIYIVTVFLLVAFASACTTNTGSSTNTNSSNTSPSNTGTAGTTTPKPSTETPKTSPSNETQAERIQLPKGEQVAVISGTLGSKDSKKYVAYVIKGNMICIVPSDDLASNIRVKLDGKEFDFRDSTCGEHQTTTKEHIIEIYNNADKNSAFKFDVGFSEHG